MYQNVWCTCRVPGKKRLILRLTFSYRCLKKAKTCLNISSIPILMLMTLKLFPDICCFGWTWIETWKNRANILLHTSTGAFCGWVKVLIDDPPTVKLRANGPGGLPYERGMDAPRKFWIKPLKETNLGVAPFFTPKRDHFKLWLHESSK